METNTPNTARLNRTYTLPDDVIKMLCELQVAMHERTLSGTIETLIRERHKKQSESKLQRLVIRRLDDQTY